MSFQADMFLKIAFKLKYELLFWGGTVLEKVLTDVSQFCENILKKFSLFKKSTLKTQPQGKPPQNFSSSFVEFQRQGIKKRIKAVQTASLSARKETLSISVFFKLLDFNHVFKKWAELSSFFFNSTQKTFKPSKCLLRHSKFKIFLFFSELSNTLIFI